MSEPATITRDLSAMRSASVAREHANNMRVSIWGNTVKKLHSAVARASDNGYFHCRVEELDPVITEPGLNKELGEYLKKLGYHGISIGRDGSEAHVELSW
jgi:hypothetical protein